MRNIEAELASLATDVKYLRENFDSFRVEIKTTLTSLSMAEKQNTEFRQRAIGIIGAISFLCTTMGALVVVIIDKILI